MRIALILIFALIQTSCSYESSDIKVSLPNSNLEITINEISTYDTLFQRVNYEDFSCGDELNVVLANKTLNNCWLDTVGSWEFYPENTSFEIIIFRELLSFSGECYFNYERYIQSFIWRHSFDKDELKIYNHKNPNIPEWKIFYSIYGKSHSENVNLFSILFNSESVFKIKMKTSTKTEVEIEQAFFNLINGIKTIANKEIN